MKREEKYPETPYFTYYNANTKNKLGGDCVVRAIATALNQSWETTVRELTELGIKKGLVLNDRKLYPKYLELKGFTQQAEPRERYDNTKMSVKRFIHLNDEYLQDCVIVANVGSHHVACIKDMRVHDTWDSSKETIHKYWIRKERI